MTGMGTHESPQLAAGAPLRRAYVAAWLVFLAMAGTTMAFQVFHAITRGDMPWPLAVLYGVVPLGISIGVLEFASVWGEWWAKAVAYTVTAGAMFLSAAATGTVSAHAAPSHAELLFGALMDASALLAIHFILSGPRAAGAVAAVDRKIAALSAEADAERAAREAAEADRNAAVSAREDAVRATAEALERAEALAQKLADVSAPKARRQPAKAPRASARATAQGDDVTTELRALMEMKADPELRKPRMGGELARRLGVSPATGRRLHSRLSANGEVAEPLGERSADERDERSGERS